MCSWRAATLVRINIVSLLRGLLISGSQLISFPTRREELLKTISHTELHRFQWIFLYVSVVLVWFIFSLLRDLWPKSYQYSRDSVFCSPAHVPLLPSGNSVFDISRACTCCCREIWSNFCFPCRSKWPVEGAVVTERFGVRQSLLWWFKWRVQKRILFPFTWKIHNPNYWLCSWDFFFTWSLTIWLLTCAHLDSCLSSVYTFIWLLHQ